MRYTVHQVSTLGTLGLAGIIISVLIALLAWVSIRFDLDKLIF